MTVSHPFTVTARRKFRGLAFALRSLLLVQAVAAVSYAQLDLTVTTLARSHFVQTDANTLVETEARLVMLLYSNHPTLNFQGSLTVEGIEYPLTPAYAPPGVQTPERAALDRGFPNAEALQLAFPPATDAPLSITSDRGNLERNIPLPHPRPPVVRAPITNFTALQSWEGGPLTVNWRSLGVVPEDAEISLSVYRAFSASVMTLSIHRASSAELVSASNRIASGQTAGTTLTISNIPAAPGETLFGELRPLGAYHWMVRFPIRRLVPAAPVITTAPRSIAAPVGTDVTLTVAATGTGVSYQWRKDGVALPGATTSVLTLRAVQPAQAGSYTVVAASSGGETVSPPAIVSVIVPPVIASDLQGQSVRVGSPVTLSVSATGSDLVYQWQRNGTVIPGATAATLTLASAGFADAGTYRVTISNAAGNVTSAVATLAVNPVTRLANLSVRTFVGGDLGPLTVGLTVSGGTAAKPLLLRAAGPTLSAFGVTDAATAVQLALLRGSEPVAANDGWRGQAAIAAASAAVGAFAFASPSSLDAAVLSTVAPAGYTARISAAGAGGTALAEIYDATPGDTFTATTPRLTNLSALTTVGTGGDPLIAGFTVAGNEPLRVLVRAIGPSLSAFGVSDPLGDPRLELFRAGTAAAVAANDDWGSATNASQVAAAAAATGAFALSATSRDAALLVTLPPGGYTVQVRGAGASRGLALIELYELP